MIFVDGVYDFLHDRLDNAIEKIVAIPKVRFREELHAIEAVIAGQGIGIFSDVLVAREIASGTLVRPFDLCLPGYRFHLVRTPDHPREKTIQAFATWLQSVI